MQKSLKPHIIITPNPASAITKIPVENQNNTISTKNTYTNIHQHHHITARISNPSNPETGALLYQ